MREQSATQRKCWACAAAAAAATAAATAAVAAATAAGTGGVAAAGAAGVTGAQTHAAGLEAGAGGGISLGSCTTTTTSSRRSSGCCRSRSGRSASTQASHRCLHHTGRRRLLLLPLPLGGTLNPGADMSAYYYTPDNDGGSSTSNGYTSNTARAYMSFTGYDMSVPYHLGGNRPTGRGKIGLGNRGWSYRSNNR